MEKPWGGVGGGEVTGVPFIEVGTALYSLF
jgi:hypothetical protein